jgi:hypothetical protein
MPREEFMPMTAQEGLEKWGWIPVGDPRPDLKLPFVIETTHDGRVLPKGTKVVLIGKTSAEEAREVCRVAGWRALWDEGMFFYKAVAE